MRESFAQAARQAATEWKASTPVLPDGARLDAPYRGRGPAYPFCLPVPFAEFNLLPEARDLALSRFRRCGIPWHHGIGGGPSNHLLSSQVQCANALAPFVTDPEPVRALLGSVLDIAEVLPFGAETASPYDRTDRVVFEWVGLADHLGEHPAGSGTRGANNTSADAAIRYRTSLGVTELAIIEWKYTEQYAGHELGGGEQKQAIRRARYQELWARPDSPLRTDVLPYDDLFVEPFYQLMRLQLLAWRLENARELGAERVRLVYVAPSANRDLWQSLNRPSHQLTDGSGGGHELGVLDLWRAMLRRPDRFVYLDSATFVSGAAPTSREFRSRYGHLAHGAPEASRPGRDHLGGDR